MLMQLEPVQEPAGPGSKEAFLKTNYEWLCGTRDVAEIGARELAEKINSGALFVDVRELSEKPELPVPHIKYPLSFLRRQSVQVEGEQVIVVCHHGIRSIEAVRIMSQSAPAGQKLYSLKGGIMALAAANINVKS
jgi:adenylyltransferase/sulfurtransferase